MDTNISGFAVTGLEIRENMREPTLVLAKYFCENQGEPRKNAQYINDSSLYNHFISFIFLH